MINATKTTTEGCNFGRATRYVLYAVGGVFLALSTVALTTGRDAVGEAHLAKSEAVAAVEKVGKEVRENTDWRHRSQERWEAMRRTLDDINNKLDRLTGTP